MKRRTVLLGAAGLAAAYGGPFTVGALGPCERYVVDNPALESAQRIGERLIASGFDVAPGAEDRPERLQEGLPERMRRDFAAGDTVSCDGWVLSRSEAEYCVHCARSSGRAV